MIQKGGLWDLQIKLNSKTIMAGLLLCILILAVRGDFGILSDGRGLQEMIEAHAFSGRAGSASSSMKSEIFDWFDRLGFSEALSEASLAQSSLSRTPRPKNGPDSLDLLLMTAGFLFFYIKTSDMINLEPANRRFMSQIQDQDGMK
jgi:hypothetical protein